MGKWTLTLAVLALASCHAPAATTGPTPPAPPPHEPTATSPSLNEATAASPPASEPVFAPAPPSEPSPTAEQSPQPPPSPPAARGCEPLPSDAELSSWPIGSHCTPGSGPEPGVVRELRTLADGTIIIDNNGRCQRIRYRQCFTKCLPGDARIATPAGEVPIRLLRVGASVWTRAADGSRISVRIEAMSQSEIRGAHHVARVTLADGRAFTASLEHPLLGHQRVQDLAAGSRYAGSTVTAIEVVPYVAAHTYDLLPAGPTAIYWANGVPMRSTLGP